MQDTPFTIVTPVKDEAHILKTSLPSFYNVGPDEVILCTDDPTPKIVSRTVEKIAKAHNMENRTKILPVPRNTEYAYHQAWVRRSGYLAAKNDVILTTDVDLKITRNVLRAIQLVGKDNVGLVSLTKIRPPYDVLTFARLFGTTSLRILYFLLLRHQKERKSGKGLKMTLFTGLYAFYRPYWLDSEDEGVKKEWGDDFGTEDEYLLTKGLDKPLFVWRWPKISKPFYMKLDPTNEEYVLNDDLLAPDGHSELIGGSQRIHDYEELMQRIQENDMDQSSYEWY